MRACKIDRNQPAVVKALRKAGCSVQILSAVGKGCPDLAVGFLGITTMVEVKDGEAPKSQRKLTPDQVKWHRDWQGCVMIVESAEQAVRLITMQEMEEIE